MPGRGRGTSILSVNASSLALLSAVALGVVLVVVLRAWRRDRLALAAVEDALTRRATALATLHAVGREILATLDAERVFAIVERECRKVFDVDTFYVGVVDRDTRRLHPPGDPLAASVVRERREVRVEDEDGSALAAPLLVEEVVVGVVSVRSRREGAYDDHDLALLSTLAQQAAVAVENARHHALATTDSLTGLYLRDAFFRRLQEEHARARRYDGAYALLMVDLDGFKAINDRDGHLAGDRTLRAVGTAIRRHLRSADLACRYGGDEFCVLLPETDLAGAGPIAERLREGIAELVVDLDGASVRATASIGISAYPEHGATDVRTLLLRADQALYQAKRGGRDRVVTYGPGSRAQDVLNAAARPREERLG
ncbi:MAG TPA: GGDEF domain-containing protein [Candidatus Bathyarchaeia archaeon]|nr:GGDEF domain-containing protein [Candidatus Bathyarchaeia archaeon]